MDLKNITIRFFAKILNCILGVFRKIKPLPPCIYFCYNQSIHHIYHSLFIAIELSNLQKEYRVVVLSTSRESSKIIEKELSSIPNNVKFIKIYHTGYWKTKFSIYKFVLMCRLRMHKPKAVVVTDYYDNIFRQMLLETFWVYTFHGPENRGFSHPHIRKYNLLILPGEGELKRIESIIGVLNNYAICGYSKFDYFRYHKITHPDLFKNSKPVIMYNPHFEKYEGSFFDKGQDLLEALSKTGKYNVIFMPHPDLARRYPEAVNKARDLQNIAVIDRPRINLDYMAITDLYITDISSAVFEWFYFDKPTLFFNTRKIDFDAERLYVSWRCGEVITGVPAMVKAIEKALKNPNKLWAKRKSLFANTFSNMDKNVSKLAAETIWIKLRVPEKKA